MLYFSDSQSPESGPDPDRTASQSKSSPHVILGKQWYDAMQSVCLLHSENHLTLIIKIQQMFMVNLQSWPEIKI